MSLLGAPVTHDGPMTSSSPRPTAPSDPTAAGAAQGAGRRLRRSASYAAATVAVVAALAVGVVAGVVTDLDEAVVGAAISLSRSHPRLLDLLIATEQVLRPIVLHTGVAVLCLTLGWRLGLWRRAGAAFASLMLIWGVGVLIKQIVGRQRPNPLDPVWEHWGLSFPSGHATNAASIAVTLVVLLWPWLGSRRSRRLAIGAGMLLVATSVLDRVLLGVHYPSDVTAGVVLGGGLAWAAATLWRHLDSPSAASADPR